MRVSGTKSLILLTVAGVIVAATLHAAVLTYITSARVSEVIEIEEGRQVAAFIRREVTEHFVGELFLRFRREDLREETATALLTLLEPYGGFRFKVHDEKGAILWSDEPRLIGRAFPDNHLLNRALTGVVVSKIERPSRTEHRYERGIAGYVSETYIPFFSEEGRVVGVVEVYRNAEETMANINRIQRVVWIGAALATVLLCAVLAMIVGLGQRRVLRLQEQLRERADELEKAKLKLEAIVEGVGVGLYLVGQGTRILWSNRVMTQWVGARNDLVGQPCHKALWGRDTPCEDCPSRRVMESGRESRAQRTHAWNGAPERHLTMIAWPIRDHEGKVAQSLVLVQDVTQVTQLQAQVLHQEKMASLGRLAAGIAHEIGNPLSSISAVLQKMLRRSGPEIKADLDAMQDQVERINRIMRSMGTMTGPSPAARQVLDLNSVVAKAVSVMELDTRWKRHDVSVDLALKPLLVHGNADQLLQVFLNIMLNALDAMGSHGRLEICTACQNSAVEVSMADSGPGIAPSVWSRLFEPFVTTKPLGQGTGLGLHISWNIVAGHGGTISVGKSETKGSLFTVVLPASPSAERQDS